MNKFARFIGIDYSGAQTADARLRGLQLFATQTGLPRQISPPTKPSGHWTRRELADWLVQTISNAEEPCLVGIDHAFSFPLQYFDKYALRQDWHHFLDDFVKFWPTHEPGETVRSLLTINQSTNTGRTGQARWKRLTDSLCKGAKSVFHFGAPGAVASSTHAGLPWLHHIRHHESTRNKIHFWPFDGWTPLPGRTVIAEVYPALWNKQNPIKERTQDEHDAWSVALALHDAYEKREVERWFDPALWQNIRLTPEQRLQAKIEGWILGLQ